MIQHYSKVALRNLMKYKTQNLISTIGLAMGLLCFSICFYCSRYMQSVDQCFNNYHRLVDINLADEGRMLSGTPAILAEKLTKEYGHEVEAYSRVAYARQRPFDVYTNDEKKLPYTFECIEVDSFFNRLFTPTVVAGSWRVAAYTPNAVVITESTARKLFPYNQEAIGKRMVMTSKIWSSPKTTPDSGGISYTIQAVIKDIPANVSMNFMRTIEVLILIDSEGLFKMTGNNDQTGVYTYGLLHEGRTAKDLNEVYRKSNVTHRMFNCDYDLIVSPIGKSNGNSDMITIFSSITSIVAVLILLVALLNFFHFQIGSIINRQREFTIRKIIGNDMFHLAMMLFVQLFLVIVIASLFMFGLIEILSSGMHISLSDLSLSIDRERLMLQAGQYIIILLIATFVICFSVAFYIRRVNIQLGMSNGLKSKKHFFRNSMLGIQFFICWLFVSMTVALYLQTNTTISTLYNTLTKAEKNSILSLKLDYTFMKNEEKVALVERIRQYSGVKDVLLSEDGYLNGSPDRTGIQLDKDSDRWLEINIMRVTPDFISFMNIPLSAGQNMEGNNDILVDEIFMNKKENILGTTLYHYKDAYTVRGILSSFTPSVYAYKEEQTPYVFFPMKDNGNVGHCYIKCYTDKKEEVRQWMTQLLQEVLPESVEPEITTFLDDIIEQQAMETKFKNITLFFSIVSLIITLLGVYSAITLDTERRQKEVAIRKINGAGIKQIILLFSRLYMLLLTTSALLAFPVVYVILHMWKEIYQIFFNDGILYWVGIFVGVTLLTALTVIFRILRIVRLNPAEVIKNE